MTSRLRHGYRRRSKSNLVLPLMTVIGRPLLVPLSFSVVGLPSSLTVVQVCSGLRKHFGKVGYAPWLLRHLQTRDQPRVGTTQRNCWPDGVPTLRKGSLQA